VAEPAERFSHGKGEGQQALPQITRLATRIEKTQSPLLHRPSITLIFVEISDTIAPRAFNVPWSNVQKLGWSISVITNILPRSFGNCRTFFTNTQIGFQAFSSRGFFTYFCKLLEYPSQASCFHFVAHP
jgi:hypothetical protein